jgi:hypothetical protein
MVVYAAAMSILPSLLLSLLPNQPAVEPVPTVVFSSPAAAAAPEEFPPLEYTYAEASYVWLDSDALNEKIDGWELLGSFELPMNFFLQGSARKQSGDTDLTTYKLGAGWHFGLVGRLDAYGILSYQHLEADGPGGNSNDDAAAGELGLRFSLLRNLELNTRGQWADVGDRDVSYGLGARFYMTERFSVGANWDEAGNDTLITAGVRVEL